MDVQAQEFLKAVKVMADAPRKTVARDNARFLNPATFQQLSEYLSAPPPSLIPPPNNQKA